MEEWKEYRLGDCVEAVIDNRGKSAPTKPLGEFPLLEINSIGGYYPNYSVIRKYVDKVTYNTWFRSGHPICGDILIPTVGTIGIISIMDNHKACIAQNLIALRTKKEISNIFIYYFLKSPIVKKQLINLDIGGVQPSIKVPHLLNLSISLPEKDIQHRIASILSSLDDKIEVNRKINENLEQQAQALFKSWFVDFEPFKNGEFEDSELGMIPKGWRVGNLGDLLEIKYGKDHKKLADGKVPVYGSGGLMRRVDKTLYIGESVLIPRKGTLNNVMYVNEGFWTVDTMFYTIPKIEHIALFCYLLLSGKDLASMNAGSAVPSMTTEILNSMPVVIPQKNIVNEFDSVVSSYFRKIESNNQESRRLAELRDTLLPKLMSGELKINEIA